LHRDRIILFWRIKDIWFDEVEFTRDQASDIVLLHSDRPVDSSLYSLSTSGKTILLDLTRTEQEILRNFDQKLRWSINRSSREHLVFAQVSSAEDWEVYHHYLVTFCSRKGIAAPPLNELSEHDVFVATDGQTKEYLGGCCFLKDERCSIYRYKHSAMAHRGQENEALLWHVIRHAKEQGFQHFDRGGVIVTNNKKSPHYTHFVFKRRFGGELTDFHEYVRFNSRFLKLIYGLLMRPLLSVLLRGSYIRFVNTMSKVGLLR
jgi:hypothetical protein